MVWIRRVVVVGLVAGHAEGAGILVIAAGMTGFTGESAVSSGQREPGRSVAEVHDIPDPGSVAPVTVRRESAFLVVRVRRRLELGQVAVHAVGRLVDEGQVASPPCGVAAFAVQSRMGSKEGKPCQLMVLLHLGALVEAPRRVALRAVISHLAIVDILVAVRT